MQQLLPDFYYYFFYYYSLEMGNVFISYVFKIAPKIKRNSQLQAHKHSHTHTSKGMHARIHSHSHTHTHTHAQQPKRGALNPPIFQSTGVFYYLYYNLCITAKTISLNSI